MRLLVLCGLILGPWLVGATPSRAGIDPDHERPLPWRSEGRLLFIADLVTVPGNDSRTRVDVAVRIPGDQLRYIDRGDSLVGSVRLSVQFKSRFGKPEHKVSRELVLVAPPRAKSGYSPGHLLLESFRVPPGRHQVIVAIEDLQQNKRGLAYVGRKVPEKGVAEGLTAIRGYPVDSLTVGDPLLVWTVGSVDSSTTSARAFERVPGQAAVLPNPDRTYGLFASHARAYFEVHPVPGAIGKDTVFARVRTVQGGLLALLDSSLVDGDAPWSGRIGFDVSTLPAGAYDLEIEVASDSHRAVSRNRFNIAWRRESWERDPREFLEEAHFLLDNPDLELKYSESTAGEQEAWLDRFWKDRDPSPMTAQNEERDRFDARVKFANEHYSIEGVTRGMLSDRGRIFIRFGEPDETYQQVIPTGDETLVQVMRDIAINDDDPAAVQLKKPSIGGDDRPFEIWIYNRASESEAERLSHGSQRRLERKFVFVDERGYGNYTLKYSSE